MKLDELNHPYTSDALSVVNEQIIDCITKPDDSESGFVGFLALARKRDDIVQTILKESPPDIARAFADKELIVNQKLLEVAQTLLKSAKDDVSHFIRSQAAIKKYK